MTSPDDLSVVGHPSITRVDALGKSVGEAVFTEDIILPRMLVGRILRSPYAHARIVSIDTTAAKNLPGVKAVITGAEAPTVKLGLFVVDEEVLNVSKVRFVGDHVAAVAAVDEDTAEEALRLIKVEYEPLPAVYDPIDALRPDAPRIHDGENNIGAQFAYTRGDPDAAFAQADLILEEHFSTPAQNHATIERFCCLARFEADGKGTIWGGLKDIFGTRSTVARYLGIPENDIRVLQSHVGGCFGGKVSQARGAFCCIAALLSRATGRPVKLVSPREDELLAVRRRIPITFDMKLGLKADGTLLAKETKLVANAGAFVGLGTLIYSTAGRRHESLYRLKNIRTEALLVYTNTLPGTSFRGFGNAQGHFALEQMMDMAAEKLGLDPLEIRRRNATQLGDVTAHGWEIQSCGLTDCIDVAAEKINWQEHKAGKPANVGLGAACMIHGSGRRSRPGFCGSKALVKIDKDGRATVFSGEGDLGQGYHTVLSIIAAEELGIPMENVKVAQPDTDIAPFALGLFSDRGTILGGNAVRLAAQDARRQLLQAAADMMEANVDDLRIKNGQIFVQGDPDRSLPIGKVAGQTLQKRNAPPAILGQATYEPPTEYPDPATMYGNISTSYTFATQIAEVEVDRETGQVKVLRMSVAHDVGKTINPVAAEGQLDGAVVQGLGYALLEEYGEDNQNSSLLDYRMPTSLEVPEMESAFIETNDPFGPYGAKGVGEPGLVAMAPAVANAVYDAVGVRITELPITPEKILTALRGKQNAQATGS